MPERPEVAADSCSARELPPEETAARCSSDLARRQEGAEAAFARVWAAVIMVLRTRFISFQGCLLTREVTSLFHLVKAHYKAVVILF